MYRLIVRLLGGMARLGRGLLMAAGACLVGLFAFGGGGAVVFLTLAMVLGVTGFVFSTIGRRLGNLAVPTDHLMTNGLRGTATVVSLGDSGVLVNDEPVVAMTLDVSLPGTTLYRVEVRQLITSAAVDGLVPGAQLPVIVDPNDLTRVMVDFGGELEEAADAAPGGIPEGKVGSAAELLARGIRGSAVITAMEDRGDISDLGLDTPGAVGGDDRLFVITLDVKLPGREPHTATIGHRVPQRLVGKVGPGIRVDVAVGRDDDQEVAIDWDSVPG